MRWIILIEKADDDNGQWDFPVSLSSVHPDRGLCDDDDEFKTRCHSPIVVVVVVVVVIVRKRMRATQLACVLTMWGFACLVPLLTSVEKIDDEFWKNGPCRGNLAKEAEVERRWIGWPGQYGYGKNDVCDSMDCALSVVRTSTCGWMATDRPTDDVDFLVTLALQGDSGWILG